MGRVSGQVWISLDDHGLAGALKGVAVWSANLRTSVGAALHARTKIAVLKTQAGENEAPAQGQNLSRAPAAADEGEIVVWATDEG